MNRKMIACVILVLYNFGLVIASYGAYLIFTTAKSLIEFNILALFLAIAFWVLYALLAFGVLGVNYFVWKKGWKWVFK